MTIRSGTVYLVGAGPGAPGLLTVRGKEILERADVVVHDRLISPELLEQTRPDAEVINAGKRPGEHTLSQDQINALLVNRARRGLAVARLKGGDPFVFGRGFEELCWCRKAGVPCEVVPGISSAIAAPASIGIAPTLRGVARGFAVLTGHDDGGVPRQELLRRYAHVETLMILMGVEALDELRSFLLEEGRDPSTPVAIIERAWMPGQFSVQGTLATIAEIVREAKVASPAVVIVGDVVAAGAPTEIDRPLAGQRIAVTRPSTASSELLSSLRSLGAHVIDMPLIKINPVEPMPGWQTLLDDLDWLVVTSRHGARQFARALRIAGLDARALAGARVAAVGPTTARELRAHGLIADLVPSVYRASHLVADLLDQGPHSGTVLFARGSLARDEVPAKLRSAGMLVRELEVYRTELLFPTDRVMQQISDGLDAALFAAPSTVQAFVKTCAGIHVHRHVCIGPTTAAEASRLGLENIVVAKEHSDAGMVQATLQSSTENAGV